MAQQHNRAVWETEYRLAASVDPTWEGSFYKAKQAVENFTGGTAADLKKLQETFNNVMAEREKFFSQSIADAYEKYKAVRGENLGMTQAASKEFSKYQHQLDMYWNAKRHYGETGIDTKKNIAQTDKEITKTRELVKSMGAYRAELSRLADTQKTLDDRKKALASKQATFQNLTTLANNSGGIKGLSKEAQSEYFKLAYEIERDKQAIDQLTGSIDEATVHTQEMAAALEEEGIQTVRIDTEYENHKAHLDALIDKKTTLVDIAREEAVEIANLANQYREMTAELIRMNEAQSNAVATTYQQWKQTYETADNVYVYDSSGAASPISRSVYDQINAEINAQFAAETASLENATPSVGLSVSTKKANSWLNGISQIAQAMGVNVAGLNMSSLGTSAGSVGLLAASWSLTKSFVSEAAGLEEILSEVQAYSTATTEDMELLSAKAKELGATTVYSAQESAKAMTYMAKAGWTTEEILSGMSGVISLAAASGEDLASVSSIVSDVMTAFGMDASETQHFSDVLAKTATRSNTDVAMMGETFQTVAPVAAAMGYNLEDVSTLIGLMANAGIKGSRAGTAMRNIFNGLLEGVELSSAKGGTIEYSALDAYGEMKDLKTVIEELRVEFDKMSDAERTSNAKALAGMRGFSGLLAVLNATDEEYENLREEIENADGAAEDMAETRLDNFSGQVTLLKSAWEGLADTIGEQFLPVLTKATELLTSFVGLLNKGGDVTGIIGSSVLTAGIGAGIGGIVGGLPGAALGAGIGLGAGELLNVISIGIEEYEVRTTAYTKSLQKKVDELQKTYDAIQDKTSVEALQIADELENAQEVLENSRMTAKELKEELKEAAETWASIQEKQASESAATEEDYQSAVNVAAAVFSSDGATQAGYIAILNKLMPSLGLEIGSDGALSMSQAEVSQKIEDYYADARLQQKIDYSLELQAEYNSQKKAYEDAYNEYKTLIDAIPEEYRFANLTEAKAYLKKLKGTMNIIAHVKKLYAAAYVDAAEEFYAVRESVLEFYNEYNAVLKEVGNAKLAEEEQEEAEKIAQAYDLMYSAAEESFEGQFALWEEADEIYATSMDDLQYALETQKEYYENYASAVAGALAKENEVEGLSEVVAALVEDGSTEAIAALAGMAEASISELQEYVDAYQSVYGEGGAAETAQQGNAVAGVIHEETINVTINAGDGTETGVSAWIEANAEQFAKYIAEAIAAIGSDGEEASFEDKGTSLFNLYQTDHPATSGTLWFAH